MPRASHSIGLTGFLGLLLVGTLTSSNALEPSSLATDGSDTITNLAQLTHALGAQKRVSRNVRLEAIVCSASKPGLGVVVVQDDTGVELLELGRRTEEILPGQKLRIEGNRLLLREREFGTQISTSPIIDNDGLHGWRVLDGSIALKAGRVPLELDWFNCLRNFGLDVFWQPTNEQPQAIPASALWHARSETVSSRSNGVTVAVRAWLASGML